MFSCWIFNRKNLWRTWCSYFCMIFSFLTPKLVWLLLHQSPEVVLACVKGSLNRTAQSPQLSAWTVQKALLIFYQDKQLFPEGLSPAIPAVADWALKTGVICRKLVRSLVCRTFFTDRCAMLFQSIYFYIDPIHHLPLRSRNSGGSPKDHMVPRMRKYWKWRSTLGSGVGHQENQKILGLNQCQSPKLIYIYIYMYIVVGIPIRCQPSLPLLSFNVSHRNP